MNKSKNRWVQNIVFTVTMAICFAVIMVGTYQAITDLAVENCYEQLWRQTDQLKERLQQNVNKDRELLETMGSMLAHLSNLEGVEASQILEFEQTANMLEKVELMLPGGCVIGAGGALYGSESEKVLDYGEEAAQGVHITGRLENPIKPGEWLAYHIVPVERDGEVVGLLCGRINLTAQQENYQQVLGENGSRFHLFEGISREFLIDTMHDNLATIDLSGKETKAGTSVEQAMDDMTAGKAGKVAFYSNTVAEYLFCVYEPVGIQDWTVLLGLPESMAFSTVTKINMFFFGCAVAEALVLLIYFVALLLQSRKMANELEEQYHRTRKLQRIQENLFHSVLRQEKMTEALTQVAEFLAAMKVDLKTHLHQNSELPICFSSMSGQSYIPRANFPALMQLMESEDHIFFSDVDKLPIPEEERERLRQNHVQNGMAITLTGSDQKYRGILFAVNVSEKWKSAEPLEWMRFGFSMALENMEAFMRIKELGSRDQLTGLMNRNSYQKAMEFYEKIGAESLSCVYIDVDGLHELNNKLGHSAGDRMLTTVSHILQELFGDETVYRIGGDEFLVFCCGVDEAEMKRRLDEMQRSIIGAGYHVSQGMSTRTEASLVYEMVRLAESRMYESKRQYYRDRKNGTKVREMNRQLEATLLEKRDLDAFCAVLSYRYVGIYIVDLSLDITRAINISEYFIEKLQEVGGKFSDAVKIYAEEKVEPANREDFLKLLDFDWMFEELSRGECPEVSYMRQGGDHVLLKVYPTPNFDEFQKECIWTFEILEEKR